MASHSNRNIFYSLIISCAIAGLLCFAQVKGNPLLIYICLGIYLVSIAYFTSQNFALPVLLFYLPWSKILRVSPTSYSFFTIALLLVCAINLLIRHFQLKRYCVTIGIILVCLTLLAKLLQGNELSLSYIMFMAMIVLFPMIKEERKANSYDFFTLVLFLSFGVILASLCAEQLAEYNNISKFIRVDSYLTITRRCGFYGDPNFYNAQVTAAMAGCMVLILQVKEKRKVALLGVLTIILLYCGLLSGSKSFLLVFLCMLLLWLYQLGKMRGRNGLKIILIITLLVFSVYISTSALFGGLIQVILTRLSFTKNISDFTTGRTELWMMYLERITTDLKTFLLGEGCTSVKVNGLASHNTILQAWYQMGIIGVIPFAFWYGSFMADGAKKLLPGERINAWMLFVGVFLPWLAIDMLFFDEFFLFSLYVLVGLAEGSTKEMNDSMSINRQGKKIITR